MPVSLPKWAFLWLPSSVLSMFQTLSGSHIFKYSLSFCSCSGNNHVSTHFLGGLHLSLCSLQLSEVVQVLELHRINLQRMALHWQWEAGPGSGPPTYSTPGNASPSETSWETTLAIQQRQVGTVYFIKLYSMHKLIPTSDTHNNKYICTSI